MTERELYEFHIPMIAEMIIRCRRLSGGDIRTGSERPWSIALKQSGKSWTRCLSSLMSM